MHFVVSWGNARKTHNRKLPERSKRQTVARTHSNTPSLARHVRLCAANSLILTLFRQHPVPYNLICSVCKLKVWNKICRRGSPMTEFYQSATISLYGFDMIPWFCCFIVWRVFGNCDVAVSYHFPARINAMHEHWEQYALQFCFQAKWNAYRS